jgi:hypothetical protein
MEVTVLSPRYNDRAQALQRFVKKDCPESHVEIKGSTVSKPFKVFEQFVNGWHWVWLANDPFV